MSRFISDDGILNWEELKEWAPSPIPKFEREFSRNHGGQVEQNLAVIHYTCGASLESTVRYLMRDHSRAAYHILIGRNGDLTQLVDFEHCAWHAGNCKWKGVTHLNKYSIGIGLCNYGPLLKQAENDYYTPAAYPTSTAKVLEEDTVKKRHKNGDCVYGYWEKYPERQLFTLALVMHALLTTYPITEIVGHDDIAPGRKIDPGPAFPLNLCAAQLDILRRETI